MQYRTSHLTMRKSFFLLIVMPALVSLGTAASRDSVLIVQDEMPALKVLGRFLEDQGELNITIVDQAHLPQDLSPFGAVIGYIHKGLEESVEVAIIDYTKQGGRYIALHHSISSGKAQNKYYFDFLGMQLDHPKQSRNPVKPGEGYAWVEGENIVLTLVNLNPGHYITSHKVPWDKAISYRSSDGPSAEKPYPSIALPDSEVYMNHKFTDGRQKTVLCGFKFFDKRNNTLFMQDRAVWLKQYGKGDIVYLMPGHKPSDYENQSISQMILNAIQWTP
jgi:hypothetical protein